MNLIFTYLIKCSVSLAFLYCLFRFTMRNNRNHALNRYLLLGILFVSSVIPLLNVQLFYEEIQLAPVEFVREIVASPMQENLPLTDNQIEFPNTQQNVTINLWLVSYLALAGIVLLRLLFGLFQVTRILNRAEKQTYRKVILAVVKDFIQPFSFLNKVVLSEKDYNENKDIVVAHEYAHIKYLHAVDLMICELFTIVQFFNPFMWLLRRDLKLIHEYQADKAVLNKGIDAQKYQLLVLEKAVGERRFAMANHFTQKPILKRLNMMNKNKIDRWAAVKLLLFVPIIAVLLQAFARPEILVEKANSVVPFLTQQDSTKVWLDKWTVNNMKNLNGGIITVEHEVKPPPPEHCKSNLPKYDKDKHGVQIPMANILTLLINRNSKILAAGSLTEKDEVLVGVENFLRGNPPFDRIKKGPEMVEKNFSIIGDVKVSKGVITLRYDKDTQMEFVQKLLRGIGEKHLEARQVASKKFFGTDYFGLLSQQKAEINQLVPIRVSIMPPKTVKAPPPPPPIFRLHLYENKIMYDKNEKKLTEVAPLVTKWLKRVNKRYYANIQVHGHVSDERINALKGEMKKGGIGIKISVRKLN